MTVLPSERNAWPYHRLVRLSPAYRWWRMPLAGLVATACFLASVVGGVAILGLTAPSLLMGFDPADLEISVRSHPVVLVVAYLSIALLLPCVLLGLAVTGLRPVGFLSSVVGRLRWAWLARAFAVSAVLVIVALLIQTLVIDRAPVDPPDRRVLIGLAVVLVLTPFQAAAEEYLFRGYLMQLVGSWFRLPLIAVVVNVGLFTLGHDYNLWGLLDVASFGLAASILTLRTGGLEAGIAMHVANNAALGLFEAFDLVDADASDFVPGPADVLPSIAVTVIVAAVLAHLFGQATRRGSAAGREPDIAAA